MQQDKAQWERKYTTAKNVDEHKKIPPVLVVLTDLHVVLHHRRADIRKACMFE